MRHTDYLMQEADRLRKGEPKLGEGGSSGGVPLKHYQVWSSTALKTARNDLLEHGTLVVRGEEGSLRKLKEIDFYLATQGIRYDRVFQSGWHHFTFKGFGPKLVVCYHGDCMRIASYGWHYKQLEKVVFPACGEHVQDMEEKLGQIIQDQLVKVELPLDWPPSGPQDKRES